MDSRLRYLRRQHSADPGDIQIHARLLSSAIRAGFLNFPHALLCAFLDHPAARLVLINEAKKDGVIFKGKKIPNIEIIHLIGNIPQWGEEAARRAALAIANLCVTHLKYAGQTGSFYTLAERGIEAAECIIKRNGPDDKLWTIIRNIRNIQSERNQQIFSRREKISICERMIVNFLIDCVTTGSHIGLLKASTAWFDDDKLKVAVRAELYPWALGEFV